uniref:Prostate-associated microseminoprotein-like protein n=1 Tax=Callorhinchus milii TaxID=7868 RepID=V9LIB8_CALMI
MAPCSMMKRFLLLFSALTLLASRGHTECFFDGKASCEHEGQSFEIGESWTTQDCYQCLCLPFGVGCCNDLQPPVDYPRWCEVIRQPGTCRLVVVMKANHQVLCMNRPGPARLGAWNRERPVWEEANEPIF